MNVSSSRSKRGRGWSLLKGALISLASLFFFCLVWQVATWTGLFGLYPGGLINLVLPSPLAVAQTGWEKVLTGELPRHIGISLFRVGAGFGIGGAAGVLLGLLMAGNRSAYAFLIPYVRLFQPIPGVAWVPLAIIWFGLGNRAAIFIISVATLFPILLNVITGLQEVNQTLMDAARTLGAERRHLLLKVTLPSLTPYLIVGLRVGMGFAWRVVLAAEMVGVPFGLGYLLMEGRGVGRTDITILTMVCLGVIMLLLDGLLFAALERKTLGWKAG